MTALSDSLSRQHLTGGLIKAGFHEVVVNEATIKVGPVGAVSQFRCNMLRPIGYGEDQDRKARQAIDPNF